MLVFPQIRGVGLPHILTKRDAEEGVEARVRGHVHVPVSSPEMPLPNAQGRVPALVLEQCRDSFAGSPPTDSAVRTTFLPALGEPGLPPLLLSGIPMPTRTGRRPVMRDAREGDHTWGVYGDRETEEGV